MASHEEFPAKNRQVHRLGIYATVVLVAFLLGFIPMWLTARTHAEARTAAEQALRIAQIENSLAAATIQARRGEYEPARDSASAFYTSLQAELGRADFAAALPARDSLQGVLAERDQMITLLARGDAAAADRLATTYIAYRQAVGSLPPAEGTPAAR